MVRKIRKLLFLLTRFRYEENPYITHVMKRLLKIGISKVEPSSQNISLLKITFNNNIIFVCRNHPEIPSWMNYGSFFLNEKDYDRGRIDWEYENSRASKDIIFELRDAIRNL